MPYEKLKISTPSPVLSLANHPLDSEETKMAKNVLMKKFTSLAKVQFAPKQKIMALSLVQWEQNLT
ncbi:MAG: hypothetical protein HXY43_15465 [Fischerella sp.]|jgi:hypothetical protein|uniref:hypothetical protein n=1 Tax=Fischerella sp. TaxID=1191 RepID=UPI0018550594|nr:hypothetical protein [Fischerella sp.]NWF60611.1 hypothetical protein [Fischerella sp.]